MYDKRAPQWEMLYFLYELQLAKSKIAKLEDLLEKRNN